MTHKLRVLGAPQVLDDTGAPVSLSLGKPLAVLIFVACSPSPVSRDDLADLLWPDADRQKGRHSVRQALWVLKNALGDDIFQSHDPLSLREGTLAMDLSAFSEALLQGRVEEARSLWRGPVLDHFVLAGVRHWNHWAEDLRGDLERRFCKALLRHAQDQASEGDAAGAVSALDQAIEVAPASEAPHLARIELLLDLLRLDAAREAIADAYQTLGDRADSAARLAAMEERLQQVIQEQRARVVEGETFPMEFVGRSRELAGLQALWRDADIGLTRVAVVTGPSGIGKTRLAQELLAYVSGNEIRAVALKGIRAGMKLRWGAASDMVRELLRQPGSAGISSASDSLLRAMLPSMGTQSVDLQMVNGMSPAAILDAVTDLMESVTFEAPLVVLLDDFQWMDPESRTLFLGLANRCRELRVLFLILGRSDLSSRHWEEVEKSLVAESGARAFLLKPLIEEEVGELLALGAAFPDPQDAPEAVAKIHQASAGNPLFIREILKELHEKGILVREGPGWVFQTSQIPDSFELPENIRILLQERLDRLSEAAANLAATLAKANRKTPPEALKRDTQLPESVFTKAVAELLERGVIEWVDGTSLDFVHDRLRDTAASHLSGSLPGPPLDQGWFGGKRRLWTSAVLATVSMIIVALWWAGALPWEPAPHPPRYGGGVILFNRQNISPLVFPVTSGAPEEWVPTTLHPPEAGRSSQYFPGPEGASLYFSNIQEEDGPDLALTRPNGTRIRLFPAPGDQTFHDLSPDRSRILFSSENVGTQPYSSSLYIGGLETGSKDLVYRGNGHVHRSIWSPDGDLVAFIAKAASDTIAVYSLLGNPVAQMVAGDVSGLTWCGPSLVIATAMEEQGYLLRATIPDLAVDTLARIEPGTTVSCSPDGTALAYVGIQNRHLTPLIMELETGAVFTLSSGNGHLDYPRWRLDEPTAIPTRLIVPTDTIRMEWGEKLDLSATVLFSDGTESSEGIRWESLDPAVASVGPNGALTGNGGGSATFIARWGYSLLDTVLVVVEDTGGGREIHREEFSEIHPTLWRTIGSPPPEAVVIDGAPALRLRGDEKYYDGVLFWEPLSLDQGITIELEFKMEITQGFHQNVSICVNDLDLEASDLETGAFSFTSDACLHYPAQEAEKLDRSELSVVVSPGRERMVRVPESLPNEGWTHLALQVRADGLTTIVVNHQRLASNPVALNMDPSREWHLIVDGSVLGTELFVRNLTIWPGERY